MNLGLSILDSEYEVFLPGISYFYIYYMEKNAVFLIVAIFLLAVGSAMLEVKRYVENNWNKEIEDYTYPILGAGAIFVVAEFFALYWIFYHIGLVDWKAALVVVLILVGSIQVVIETFVVRPLLGRRLLEEGLEEEIIAIYPFMTEQEFNKTKKKIREGIRKLIPS